MSSSRRHFLQKAGTIRVIRSGSEETRSKCNRLGSAKSDSIFIHDEYQKIRIAPKARVNPDRLAKARCAQFTRSVRLNLDYYSSRWTGKCKIAPEPFEFISAPGYSRSPSQSPADRSRIEARPHRAPMARGAAVLPESVLLDLGPPPLRPYPSHSAGAELDL